MSLGYVLGSHEEGWLGAEVGSAVETGAELRPGAVTETEVAPIERDEQQPTSAHRQPDNAVHLSPLLTRRRSSRQAAS